MTTATHPTPCTEEHLDFLDELRESGATNMYGAAPYLVRKFRSLSKGEAGEIVQHWMRTFSARQKAKATGATGATA